MSIDEKIETIEDVAVSLEEALDGVEVIEITAEEKRGGRAAEKDIVKFEAAYRLYMQHNTYSDICQQLDLKMNTLTSWVRREGWSAERDANDAQEHADILAPRSAMIGQLAHHILQGCLKTVMREAKDGFKTKDLPTMIAAVSSIEKLHRLAQGKSTSISEERSKRANFTLPMDQLKNITSVKVHDPFAITETNDPTKAPLGPSGSSEDS